LIRSIEELVKDINKAELFKIKFNVKGIPHSQEADYELILFRMIQESLNNVIRHANATEVSITLDYEKTSLSVRIRDNGTGFKTENTKFNNNGSGLGNMKKRAQMINAQLFIDSQPQNGTLIKILIPLSNN
jgi:signal transduction histidine kinase